jgi:hypothetical protein
MINHIWGLLCFVVISAGPLPLCLGIIFLLENKTGNENREKPGFSHHLFIIMICWCILETLIGLILGIVHQLNRTTVLLVEMIIFSAGLALLIFIKRKQASFGARDLLPVPRWFDNPGKLMIGVICMVCFFLLWTSLTCPIKEYDSLAYHLPAMAKWYQSGSLSMPGQFSKLIRWYPYNWEVLSTLYLMPFDGDFTAAIPNIIAWALFGLSVYLLGLKIRAARIHSLAASSLVMTVPIVLHNVNTMHIDLPFAVFFMAGLYLCVHSVHTRSLGYFSLFLASSGMLMGIKTSGLIYGFILVILFVLMLLKSIYFDKRPPAFSLSPASAAIAFSITGGLSFLLLGGSWYLRNFVQAGNPLVFVKIKLGNLVLFPGKVDPSTLYTTTLAKIFNLGRLSHWEIFLNQVNIMLGIPFFALIFLSLILVFARKKSVNIRTLTGLFALFAVTLILYWFTPYSGSNFTIGNEMTPWFGQAMRYAFPFIGVLGVIAAAGAGGTKKFHIPDLALAAVVLIAGIRGLDHLGKNFTPIENTALYAGVFLLILWGRGSALAKKIYKYSLLSSLVVLVLIITLTFNMRDKRDANRRLIYGGIVDYIENQIARDETIGYMYSHQSYLFYGKKFNRNIIFVQPGVKTLSQWLDMLKEKGVDVIALGPVTIAQKKQKRLKEHLKWLIDPDGPFTHCFGSNLEQEPFIFRFKTIENVKK